MGLYWLPVELLISIILKAFEPIAQFVACEQEDRDLPKVRKQLRLEECSHRGEDLEQMFSPSGCCTSATAIPLFNTVCADQAP